MKKEKWEYKGEYTKVIAISESDKNYIISLKANYPKMSQAGILKYIIKDFKKRKKRRIKTIK